MILDFWLKGAGVLGLEDFGNKGGGGGSQMVDHIKIQGVCKF